MSRNRRILLQVMTIFIALSLLMSIGSVAVMASETDDSAYTHFYAYKFASKSAVGPRQSLTYTILLYNSGVETVTAEVVDTLPPELNYVEDSASNGGIYSESDGSLTWESVEVPFGSEVQLTFEMSAPLRVFEEAEAVNTATVTTDGNTIETEFTVMLLTQPPLDDVEYPVVESVVIDDKDILYDRGVSIQVEAADNYGVETMMIKEWQVIDKPQPHWEEVRSSGWVEYEEMVDWELGDLPGVHFVGVWVADAAGNISHATQSSFDFASYLEQSTSIENKITNIPYAAYYPRGVDVSAKLTPIVGDGLMLYVWVPGNFGEADYVTDGSETIEFNTSLSGTYIFMVGVLAPEDVTYNLAISPGGGPSAWSLAEENGVQAFNGEVTELSSYFNEIGLDPISDAMVSQPQNAPIVPLLPPANLEKFHIPLIWN